jgi:hypothetical protein
VQLKSVGENTLSFFFCGGFECRQKNESVFLALAKIELKKLCVGKK